MSQQVVRGVHCRPSAHEIGAAFPAIPLKAGLPRLQQYVRLSRVDAVDQSYAAQGFVEGDEVAVFEFGDEVPFAVGAVECAHLRQAAQLVGDLVGELAEHFDHDDGAHAGGAGFVAGADGEGSDGAVGDQSVDARGDSGA